MDVRHDPHGRRFVLDLEGGEAHLDYAVLDDGALDLHHTWVDPGLRGRGNADRLVRGALEHARSEGRRVVATCSYVRAFLARHREYADLRR